MSVRIVYASSYFLPEIPTTLPDLSLLCPKHEQSDLDTPGLAPTDMIALVEATEACEGAMTQVGLGIERSHLHQSASYFSSKIF